MKDVGFVKTKAGTAKMRKEEPTKAQLNKIAQAGLYTQEQMSKMNKATASTAVDKSIKHLKKIGLEPATQPQIDALLKQGWLLEDIEGWTKNHVQDAFNPPSVELDDEDEQINF